MTEVAVDDAVTSRAQHVELTVAHGRRERGEKKGEGSAGLASVTERRLRQRAAIRRCRAACVGVGFLIAAVCKHGR